MEETSTVPARIIQLTAQGARLEVGGAELSWPRNALPNDINEGDDVVLKLLTKQAVAEEQYEHVRALLTEILGGGHS